MKPHEFRTLTTGLGAALAVLATALPAQAQNFPIYPAQRETAQQVAQSGVPLSELAPNAPDTYTVKRGDTLWGISGMYLKRPWRWPELWGMNLKAIPNPHLIFPGQTLVPDQGRRSRALEDGPRQRRQPDRRRADPDRAPVAPHPQRRAWRTTRSPRWHPTSPSPS